MSAAQSPSDFLPEVSALLSFPHIDSRSSFTNGRIVLLEASDNRALNRQLQDGTGDSFTDGSQLMTAQSSGPELAGSIAGLMSQVPTIVLEKYLRLALHRTKHNDLGRWHSHHEEQVKHPFGGGKLSVCIQEGRDKEGVPSLQERHQIVHQLPYHVPTDMCS